jgi:RNA polymerase sigma-70 factor (ECF subfamily)
MGLALARNPEQAERDESDDELAPRDSGVFRRVSRRPSPAAHAAGRVTGKMAMPPETSDEALMARFQDGDRSAFTALVRRHQGKLYNFTLRTLRSPQLAEDVTQETFVRVVHRSADFRGSSKFSTWLHAIARNLCIDELRKAKHRRHASLDQPAHGSADEDGGRPLGEEIAGKGQDPDRATGGNELKDRIARAVDLLPDDQREVFILREVSNLPFAEIAEIVKVPEPTVKSRMRYALERLQAALAEYEEFARALK